jgi:hypothetical protein
VQASTPLPMGENILPGYAFFSCGEEWFSVYFRLFENGAENRDTANRQLMIE